MKTMSWRWALALVMALGVAAPADAQGRRDRDRDDRYERSDDHRYGERQGRDRVKHGDRDDRRVTSRRDDDRRYERYERGDGPSFCRSGRGHPVFGWDWCRERGWDRSNQRYPVRWERRTWEDVIFRGPREDRRRVLDRRDLGDILGSVIFGRLDTRRRELHAEPSWSGRWEPSQRGRELWVTAGGIPIARLVDTNRDGRVDSVWLAER